MLLGLLLLLLLLLLKHYELPHVGAVLKHQVEFILGAASIAVATHSARYRVSRQMSSSSIRENAQIDIDCRHESQKIFINEKVHA